MPGMEPAGVEPIDDIQHEPDQSPRWQPLPQRGRHQELLITINRTIRTSHAPVFRESPQHSRTPPGDLATASATASKGAERRQRYGATTCPGAARRTSARPATG